MRKKDLLVAVQAFVVSAVVVLGGAALCRVFILDITPQNTITLNK